MANIIPLGNTGATSAEITLAAGASTTIHGSGTGEWTAQIQIKNSDASFTTLSGITARDPAKGIFSPGVYRVQRLATDVAIQCRVDQD